jgi:uncharacterized protein (TIGR03067 family)
MGGYAMKGYLSKAYPRWIFWSAIVAGALISGCSKSVLPKEEPKKEPASETVKDLRIQGGWRQLRSVIDGKQLEPIVARRFRLHLEENRFVNINGEKIQSEGTYTVNPTQSPATIDMVGPTGVKIYGIYRVEKDKLKMCFHERIRPSSFESPPGDQRLLMVLEREKSTWRQFESGDGRFKVLMPGEPSQETNTFPAGQGQVAIHKFFIFRNNNKELFQVMYLDYPKAFVRNLGTNKLLDILASGVAADAKGSLLEKRKISLAGVPGAEVKVKVPNTGIITARVFATRNRGYQVTAAMPSAKASSWDVQRFLDSFQLLKLKGD